LYHDPACQLSVAPGQIFTSTEEARANKALPPLSVFRGCGVDDVAKLAIDIRQHVTLVVDEMDRACRDKRWISENVRRVVHEGRHHQVDLFGTFRSTRNVSEDLISQCDFVFLHRHNSSAIYDVQTVERRFGPSFASAAQRMDPMQFVIWEDA